MGGIKFTPGRQQMPGAVEADNGLIVDAVTKRVQLGGPLSAPAALQSTRQIDMAGFQIRFNGTAAGRDVRVGSDGSVISRTNSTSAVVVAQGVINSDEGANSAAAAAYVSTVGGSQANGVGLRVAAYSPSHSLYPSQSRISSYGASSGLRLIAEATNPVNRIIVFGIGADEAARIDSNSNLVLAEGVSTGDPVGGSTVAGLVRIGGVVAAAAVLDNGAYIELSIGNNLYKVALIQ